MKLYKVISYPNAQRFADDCAVSDGFSSRAAAERFAAGLAASGKVARASIESYEDEDEDEDE